MKYVTTSRVYDSVHPEIPKEQMDKINEAYKKVFDKQKELSKFFGYVPMNVVLSMMK
jgi:hypothetical protein